MSALQGFGLRDREEATVLGGLAAAVAAVPVVLADLPEAAEPVTVAAGAWLVFLLLATALRFARL